MTGLIYTLAGLRNFKELSSFTYNTNIDIKRQNNVTIPKSKGNLSAATFNYQEMSTTTSKLLFNDTVTENISKLLNNLIQRKK